MVSKIDAISLSADTAIRPVSPCVIDVNKQLNCDVPNCDAISITLDESTDMRDIAQLCTFIQFINDEFTIMEDMLHFYKMKGTTRGGVFKCVNETLKTLGAPIEKISLVTNRGRTLLWLVNGEVSQLF